MEDLDAVMGLNRPTAERPLAGMTVLVVEDSRFACEAMRLLCLRSGARIRRADCLASARRHLQVYRPNAVIVDLGLPDGSGTELIRELAMGIPRVPVILGISGDTSGETRALDAGADGFMAKPIESLAAFQTLLMSHLPKSLHPIGPREVSEVVPEPDEIAFRDDLAQIAPTLHDTPDAGTLRYAVKFLTGLARSAHDAGLEEAARAVADSENIGASSKGNVIRLANLVEQRLAQSRAI